MHDIIEALRTRQSRSEFGYGLSTAKPYVKGVIDAIGEGVCQDVFRIDNAESAIKEAASRLTYANADMQLLEKATSMSRFKELVPDGIEVPKHTGMVFQHVLTTTKEDRDNDVLETKGATLDPKAPLLWQHIHTLPIGSVLAKLEHTDDKLAVVSSILDMNDLTADAMKLLEANVLRISHGFRALEFEERKEEGESPIPGFRVTKFEIMEASLVSVPSNTDAEIEVFASRKFASEAFKAMQKSYLEKRKATEPVQVAVPDIEHQLTLKLGSSVVTVSANTPDDLPHEIALESPPEVVEKSIEPEAEKAGRTLSAANLAALEDVCDDMKELGEMDIPRAGKALCQRCVSRLEKIIDGAKPRDNEEEEPEDEKKSVDMLSGEKPEEIIEDARSFVSAMQTVLELGTLRELKHLHSIIDTVLQLEHDRAKASHYRALVG